MPSDNAEQNLFADLAEILAKEGTSPYQPCENHPDQAATAICLVCGAPLCPECRLEAMPGQRCRRCRKNAAATHAFRAGLRSLRLPVFWVMLCILIAAIAYACGVGNPTPERLRVLDARRTWFNQEAGKLYLNEASRENRRAAALLSLKRNAEAAQWSRRAAESFARTAACWQNTPVGADLKIGEAVSLVDAGDFDAGMKLMTGLKVVQGQEIYPIYQYYLGEFYHRNNDQTNADKSFKLAFDASEHMADAQWDKVITMLSGDRREAKLIINVRKVCGTDLSAAELRKKCSDAGFVPPELPGKEPRHEQSPKPVPTVKPQPDEFNVEVIGEQKN